jgi:hypothetical protein
MATLNISLPDDLKERMERVSGVKWSRVAAEAFEREVKSRTLEGTDMTAAIERLKASRAKSEENDRQSGIEAGKAWAMREAEWDVLCTVACLDEDDPNCEEGAGFGLWGILHKQGYEGRYLAELFGCEGLDDLSDASAAGFIIGARLVKEEVDEA